MRFCLGATLAVVAYVVVSSAAARPQTSANAPLPDARKLMQEVHEHQKLVDKVREAYTYSSLQTTEDLDAKGNVTKTETTENEDFFVNGHAIERIVKKNGQPLNDHEAQKETERVTKLVEKAVKLPSDQPLEGLTVSIGRVLEVMDVSSPRREVFRGRQTIVFDFVGRKDAKAHGLAEEASKKLKGTVWIDEARLTITSTWLAGWWPMSKRGRTSASTRRRWMLDCGCPPAAREWSPPACCWSRTCASISLSACTITSDSRWRPSR